MGLIVKVDNRSYRKIAQDNWGLTDEQMSGMHVHHRIPRSQGGTNDPSNLFVCSPSYHAYVWHNEDNFTFWASKGGHATKGISKGKGKPKSKKHRLNIGKAHKGKVCPHRGKPNPWKSHRKSDEEKTNLSIRFKGVPKTKEHKQKIAEANKAASATCPHCGKIGHPGAMSRWHFDRCRHA